MLYIKVDFQTFLSDVKKLQYDEELSFALCYNGEEKPPLIAKHTDVSEFYGIKKIRAFDGDMYVLGRWGGGYNKAIEIDEDLEFLEIDLYGYIANYTGIYSGYIGIEKKED